MIKSIQNRFSALYTVLIAMKNWRIRFIKLLCMMTSKYIIYSGIDLIDYI